MPASRLAFAALAVGCLGAAAAGGYLAMRQNAVPAVTQAAAGQEPAASAPAPPAPVPAPAQPAVVGSDSAAAVPPSGPASPAAPAAPRSSAKRAEPARAPAPVQASGRPTAPERGVKAEPAAPADHPLPATGGAAQAPAPAENSPVTARADDRAQEAARAPEPSENTLDELVVSADSVIGLQAQTTVTSDRARVEDQVEARVTRDVRVRGIVAIPAGARVIGSVVSVERGGKFRDRARLGIRFNTLVLPDGTRLPISTETIYREGEAPGKQSTAKVAGPAVAGAILGAIIGGGKGAAIGGAVGAGAGAGAVAAGDRSLATLYAGEPITVRLLAPVTVTIEHK
jgi:hypothetical protein